MQHTFLDRLSPDVQKLVKYIEGAIGTEIDVSIDSSRVGRGPDGSGILACKISERGAMLLVPMHDYFPDGGVVHEMLHVRRILVDGVPRLSENPDSPRWNCSIGATLTNLDNALEHLVIVPEEIRLRPERADWWASVIETTWLTKLPAIPDPEDQRRWALMSVAFLSLVLPSSAVVGNAEALLEKLDLRNDALQFLAAVTPKLMSKEELTRACFEELRLPTDIALFEYLDCQHRERREAPL